MTRNILAPRYRAMLRRFARADALLAFDFDGTLAPIVADPARAVLAESTRRLLSALARHRKVAIITGRSVADAQKRLDDVALAALVGSHGIEPSPYMATAAAVVTSWRPVLREAFSAPDGVRIEDKRHSVALHYRHVASPDDAYESIGVVVARLGAGVRRVDGIQVVNLMPVGAPDKGDALLALRERLHAATVLYVGDETTDEDAFAVLTGPSALGIRVEASESTGARYHIESQGAMDLLLGSLLDAARAIDQARPAHATTSTADGGSH